MIHEIPDGSALRYFSKIFFNITRPRAEKFTEVKCGIFRNITIRGGDLFGQVKGENVHLGQFFIRILLARMLIIPFGFRLLLVNVSPRVFVFLILAHNVIRRTRKRQHFRLRFSNCFDNSVAKISRSSFVGFVDNQQIPIHIEYAIILIVFASNTLRTA